MELGYEGTLTIDGASAKFRNLRFGLSYGEVDTTSNADAGEKSYKKGLRDKYITAEMQLDGSTACATILAACESREPVQVSSTMDDITISGMMYVFPSEIGKGLEDTGWMSITCRKAPASECETPGTE